MEFPCVECDAFYPTRNSLTNHIRLYHGGRQFFQCIKCDYSTKKKDHLKAHVKSKHDKIKEHCIYCSKQFYDKSTLQKHIKQFHQNKVQQPIKYIANNINKKEGSLDHADSLKRKHSIDGTPSKKGRADLSNEIFYSDDDESDVDEYFDPQPGSSKLRCPQCPAEFKEKFTLNRHVNSVHSEKRFKCVECDLAFTRNDHLVRHMDIHKKKKS